MGEKKVCKTCMEKAIENAKPIVEKEKDQVNEKLLKTIVFVKDGEEDRVFKSIEAAAEGMHCKVETVEAVLGPNSDIDSIRGFKLKKEN